MTSFIFSHTHAREARARARVFIKFFIYDKVINLTNYLILETPHFTKIYRLKRHMPQVIKEKEEGSIDNHYILKYYTL